MKKFPSKQRFYDVLHRGTVSLIMAGSLYIVANIGYSIFYHYKYTRPQRQEHYRMIQEEEIAQEQLERERELIRRQAQAEKLVS
ncbi:hypothetical protein CHS0354_032107 [Potamilus streckersoni]|uniref:Cytochrome c oxidase assembly protein COX14 n=1 Tax=Potamilus streckersoni TaxID=2493646 RepID=A0AAE0RLP5_9BIVA|nr:hypothetical protein CHS0354_032107 [Potamilus streckersoni]